MSGLVQTVLLVLHSFIMGFKSPALVLQIGSHRIKMPIDWQVLIGEPDLGDLEMLPLTSINDRGFKVFQFNPLTSFRPSFLDIEIVDVYHDVAWYCPKLKNGQMLCVPLTEDPEPDCVCILSRTSPGTVRSLTTTRLGDG